MASSIIHFAQWAVSSEKGKGPLLLAIPLLLQDVFTQRLRRQNVVGPLRDLGSNEDHGLVAIGQDIARRDEIELFGSGPSKDVDGSAGHSIQLHKRQLAFSLVGEGLINAMVSHLGAP